MEISINYAQKLNEEFSMFVTFKYDAILVDLIKSLPKRAYNPLKKEWEIGFSCWKPFINLLEQNNIEYNREALIQKWSDFINNKDVVQPINNITKLEEFSFKSSPREYQKEGILFGLNHPSFLLADEQGLGKSLESLGIAVYDKKGKHCLIIAGYDSLIFNWIHEIEKHTNEKGYVLGQRTIKKGINKGKLKLGGLKERYEDLLNLQNIEEYFIVTSATTIRDSIKHKYINKNGKEQENREYYFAQAINELCKNNTIGRIIFDEFHVCRNITTNQTKALLLIEDCKYKIAATGTPLVKDNTDLYSAFRWLGYEKRNFWSFRNQYCILGGFENKEVIGNKNEEELNKRLNMFMLRRKKDEVLGLPEKIIIDEYLEMDYLQQKLYNEVKAKAKYELVKCKGNRNALLALLGTLRKATLDPYWIDPKYTFSIKFDRCKQLMQEITLNNQKAIIFGSWATPIQRLYNLLAEYNPALITGEVQDRMEQVNKFQNDKNCQVILGTIGAMGTGLTLTAGSNVIFLDEPWRRVFKDQASDRAHRYGAKNNINVYTLICRNTIDEKVHQKCYQTGEQADKVVDGLTLEEIEQMIEE